MAKVSLAARVQQLEALLAAAGVANPAVARVERVVDAIVGAVPSGQILPPVADPNAHPVLASAGQAGMQPQPVLAGNAPAADDHSMADLYAKLGAVEAKLNALIAATGMTGSAAMAAHP